ncbi:hypothetical protein CTAYLR_005561 [Chrysophaeum taylorii]|uniref:Dipeptidase n=1 Tax=Chrysophaeum taylorii TaxID=2483200 RepID=A0AAD7U6B8_9STRA|nr:hypothetical protein CTAYLR_005561 [Chrysophaeum taylorii]
MYGCCQFYNDYAAIGNGDFDPSWLEVTIGGVSKFSEACRRNDCESAKNVKRYGAKIRRRLQIRDAKTGEVHYGGYVASCACTCCTCLCAGAIVLVTRSLGRIANQIDTVVRECDRGTSQGTCSLIFELCCLAEILFCGAIEDVLYEFFCFLLISVFGGFCATKFGEDHDPNLTATYKSVRLDTMRPTTITEEPKVQLEVDARRAFPVVIPDGICAGTQLQDVGRHGPSADSEVYYLAAAATRDDAKEDIVHATPLQVQVEEGFFSLDFTPMARECPKKKKEDVVVARAVALHRSHVLMDGHNDLPWSLKQAYEGKLERVDLREAQDAKYCRELGHKYLHTDWPRVRAGGLGAQFWSVYVPTTIRGPAAVQ